MRLENKLHKSSVMVTAGANQVIQIRYYYVYSRSIQENIGCCVAYSGNIPENLVFNEDNKARREGSFALKC